MKSRNIPFLTIAILLVMATGNIQSMVHESMEIQPTHTSEGNVTAYGENQGYKNLSKQQIAKMHELYYNDTLSSIMYDKPIYSTNRHAQNGTNGVILGKHGDSLQMPSENSSIAQARRTALGQDKANRSIKSAQRGVNSMQAYNEAVSPDLFMTTAQRKTAEKKMTYDLSGKNSDTTGMTKQELLDYLLQKSPKGKSASAKTAWSNEIAVLQKSIAADAKTANASYLDFLYY